MPTIQEQIDTVESQLKDMPQEVEELQTSDKQLRADVEYISMMTGVEL